MSGQHISLSRILAVNWYGFRQVLDLSEHTLIAGAFRTGKSALLDLIQYAMLGEHWRPNRAAAGNARGRSLVSYCLCDTNTTRDDEPHYVRRSGATLIGLEFTWPTEHGKTPRRETWGIRIEYASPTSKPQQTYFFIPSRLDWAEVAPTGTMLDEEEFRSFLRREYGRESLFPRQQDYLAEMATPRHLWFDPEKFRKTFPKAIAFEPEKEVEKFIREFILEESPLDVRDVRTAVGAYRETQERLARQGEEAELLRGVAKQHTVYEEKKREAAILQHLSHSLEHARLSELVARHQKELGDLQTKHADDNASFDSQVREKQQLEVAIREFRLDAGDEELRQKLSEQETKRAERKSLLEAQQAVRLRLRDLRHRWERWLKRGAEVKLDGLADVLIVDDAVLEALAAPDEATGLAALPNLAETFSRLFHGIGKLLEPHQSEISGISTRLQQIAADLDRLDTGQTPGSFPLFQAIKTRLAGSAVPPQQLCRLVEVKTDAEEWRNALELILGRNRFAIVVGTAEDYRTALEILRKRPPAERGVDESLVHPREAAELPSEARNDSLAEKVEVIGVPDPLRRVAERFTSHLLGRIVAAERVEDLDLCERGITRDGIFKQVPTRRRLRQSSGFEFTLGSEGLKRLRAALTREQQGLMAERATKQAVVDEIHLWLDTGKKGGLGDGRLPDRSSELPRVPVLEQELAALKQRIVFLSTPERSGRLRHLDDLQVKLGRANQEIGSLETARRQFIQKQKEIQDALDGANQALEAALLAMTESRVRMPQGVLDTDIEKGLNQLKADFRTWVERKEAAAKAAGDAVLEAANARNSRNNERRALLNATDGEGRPKHPQYRHDDFDPEEESNDRWQARLRVLQEVQLEESRKLAAERRKDWERRLKDQVLNRLNENLQAAERTVRQLRGYLDVPVGGHTYRISQERDQGFATLWRLLDSGFEPTDELAAVARTQEVQSALDELMTAVEADGEGSARSLALLDYRNYHRYDLKMRPAGLNNGPEISFGRSGVNMSGGENQAPFFLSMLAAFLQVYDFGGGGRAQHLGLAVMDEAFSKLSGDGVEECLELARNFNLQLLMAFPIDRLGVMAPYADTVVELRKEEVRDDAGFVVQLDNIPIILSPEQVQEKLS
jgi:hypothetical protein